LETTFGVHTKYGGTNLGRGLEGCLPATAARVCVSAARARRPGGAWRSAAAGDVTRAMGPGRAAAMASSDEVQVDAIVWFDRG
jgi:hypothetical protein